MYIACQVLAKYKYYILIKYWPVFLINLSFISDQEPDHRT